MASLVSTDCAYTLDIVDISAAVTSGCLCVLYSPKTCAQNFQDSLPGARDAAAELRYGQITLSLLPRLLKEVGFFDSRLSSLVVSPTLGNICSALTEH